MAGDSGCAVLIWSGTDQHDESVVYGTPSRRGPEGAGAIIKPRSSTVAVDNLVGKRRRAALERLIARRFCNRRQRSGGG
jgi:hypothetical protein